MLRAAAAAAGGSTFLSYFGTRLSYAEVDARTDALAVGLRKNGVERGDRVALYVQNVPQYVLGLLAAWKAGATAVSVNPMLTSRELRDILDDSGATGLVALEDLHEHHGRTAVAGSSVRVVVTTSELDDQDDPDPRLFAGSREGHLDDTVDLAELVERHLGQAPPDPGLTADDVAVLTYTSGTTRRPKGAMNTHRTSWRAGSSTASGSGWAGTTGSSGQPRGLQAPPRGGDPRRATQDGDGEAPPRELRDAAGTDA